MCRPRAGARRAGSRCRLYETFSTDRTYDARGPPPTAAKLHGAATTVYDLWAADFATEPRALALRVGRRARCLPGRGNSAAQGFCTQNNRG